MINEETKKLVYNALLREHAMKIADGLMFKKKKRTAMTKIRNLYVISDMIRSDCLGICHENVSID